MSPVKQTWGYTKSPEHFRSDSCPHLAFSAENIVLVIIEAPVIVQGLCKVLGLSCMVETLPVVNQPWSSQRCPLTQCKSLQPQLVVLPTHLYILSFLRILGRFSPSFLLLPSKACWILSGQWTQVLSQYRKIILQKFLRWVITEGLSNLLRSKEKRNTGRRRRNSYFNKLSCHRVTDTENRVILDLEFTSFFISLQVFGPV